MTPDQELKLVKMYSMGIPYKVISMEMGISSNTLASCIRRKYQDLQTQTQAKYRLLTEKYTKKFMDSMGVDHTTAQAIFGNLYERFQNKKHACGVQKIEFTLKFAELVFPVYCPLLGTKLDYLVENYRDDNYPTYDRINPKGAYTKDNTHVVSWRANRIKNNATLEELEVLTQNLRKIRDCIPMARSNEP